MHSDKTKDMPANGTIAFVTFYSPMPPEARPSREDRWDWVYKQSHSILTRLKFSLKKAARRAHPNLPKEVVLTMYPNAVLMIPLSTNRLYTHETAPPRVNVAQAPTRLSYVVRSSKTRAVYRDGGVHLLESGARLRRPDEEDIGKLKALYRQENATTDAMEYGDIDYSLNDLAPFSDVGERARVRQKINKWLDKTSMAPRQVLDINNPTVFDAWLNQHEEAVSGGGQVAPCTPHRGAYNRGNELCSLEWPSGGGQVASTDFLKTLSVTESSGTMALT